MAVKSAIVIMLELLLIFAWLTTGDNGYVVIAVIIALGTTNTWLAVERLKGNSWHLILNGAHSPVSDKQPIATGQAIAFKDTKRIRFPAHNIFAMGSWSGLGLSGNGGRADGVLVAAKECCHKIGKNWYINGFLHCYEAPEVAAWRLATRAVPDNLDPRRKLPVPVLQKLESMKKIYNYRTPIYVVLRPENPQITADAAGKMLVHFRGAAPQPLSAFTPIRDAFFGFMKQYSDDLDQSLTDQENNFEAALNLKDRQIRDLESSLSGNVTVTKLLAGNAREPRLGPVGRLRSEEEPRRPDADG
jgi:hypothetical protein